MAKPTISDNVKKRVGRPAVGSLFIGVRMPPADVLSLDTWIERQKDEPSRPEAIRRLVEIGLAAAKAAGRPSRKTAARAAELAAKAIDHHSDPTAPAEERSVRKRKILKGPSVFRDVRRDR